MPVGVANGPTTAPEAGANEAQLVVGILTELERLLAESDLEALECFASYRTQLEAQEFD
jgi:hypothetical protein